MSYLCVLFSVKYIEQRIFNINDKYNIIKLLDLNKTSYFFCFTVFYGFYNF